MNTSKHSPQVGIKALSRNWLPDIMIVVIACWLTSALIQAVLRPVFKPLVITPPQL